jgi:tetratricopeptide (TPR) repeat protein
MKQILFLVILSVLALDNRALAQFKVGDLIVVIENADVKVENEVIHQVFKGATFAVVKSEGDLLWVDASIPGWIPAGNVVPLDKAAAHFTEVIRKSPDEPRNYFHRAAVWQACHEYDKAIGDYDEAITLDPSWHGLYSGRGWCLLAKKQYDGAIADFSKSIKMEANNMVAFNRRGGAYALTGDYEKAIADYEVAIQLAPKVISARANLAELLACCPEAKWRDGKKAVELAKGLCDETKWLDSERIHYLACAYAETGDFDSAIRWEKLAIELNPPERRKALTNFRKALDLFEAHQPSHEFVIFD